MIIRALILGGLLIVLGSATNLYADDSSHRSTLGSSGGRASDTTQMDFDSSMIDGEMRAPSGFYLQGRSRQDLKSMVRLRSGFRERLEDSRSAVKAMVR